MKVTLSVVLAAVGLHAEAAQPTTRNRAEIPAQYRWDFSAIYPGWDAWEAGMKELEAKMNAFAALKGSLGKGPADLLQAYRALDEIGILQYRVFRYPQLQRDTDTRAQDVAGKFQRVSALFARFGTITAWFTPELLQIPQATVEQWIRETPELAPYRFPIRETTCRSGWQVIWVDRPRALFGSWYEPMGEDALRRQLARVRKLWSRHKPEPVRRVA